MTSLFRYCALFIMHLDLPSSLLPLYVLVHFGYLRTAHWCWGLTSSIWYEPDEWTLTLCPSGSFDTLIFLIFVPSLSRAIHMYITDFSGTDPNNYDQLFCVQAKNYKSPDIYSFFTITPRSCVTKFQTLKSWGFSEATGCKRKQTKA